MKRGVLRKLRSSHIFKDANLYDRGKFFCKCIHKLWPEGGTPPGPSKAYSELMHVLAPEKKDVRCTLTTRDFSFEPLVLCDFETRPEEIQWQLVWAVEAANTSGEFLGMQKAQRVAWFVGQLCLITSKHASALFGER